MKYIQPLGEAENASYVDGDPTLGILGSIPTAAALEHPQREIVNAIAAAGLTPDPDDLTQLGTAIQTMVTSGTGNFANADLSNVAAGSVLGKIGAGDITNTMLATGSVQTSKIADAAVTGNKVATSAVGTSNIADDSVTLAKLAHGTAGKVLGFDGTGAPAEIEAPSGGILLQRAYTAPQPVSTSSSTYVDVFNYTVTPVSDNSVMYLTFGATSRRSFTAAGEQDWYLWTKFTIASDRGGVSGIGSDINAGHFEGRTRSDGETSGHDGGFICVASFYNTSLSPVTFTPKFLASGMGSVRFENISFVVDEIQL